MTYISRTPEQVAENAEKLLKAITSNDAEYQDTAIQIPTFNLDGTEDFWDMFVGNESILNQPIPDVNVTSLTNELNEGLVDILLSKLKKELYAEYESGRITGAEYTKAFQAMLADVMGQAVQFTLQKDQAKWQAQQIQLNAIQAMYQAMLTKAQVAKTQYDAEQAKVAFLREKAGAELDLLQIETARFNLESILPAQEQILVAQKAQADVDTLISEFNLNSLLPAQELLTKAQTLTEGDKQQLLKEQKTNMNEQTNLYKQQIKSFKARDHIQGLGMMQSTWAAYASISPEVAEIPTWASPAGLDGAGGFTKEMTAYLDKAKNGTF